VNYIRRNREGGHVPIDRTAVGCPVPRFSARPVRQKPAKTLETIRIPAGKGLGKAAAAKVEDFTA